MDTPGLDVEAVTGMVGGGAQVVVFTTGLGTPTGNPIAPVIKITGNARTARQMADNIDLDVSGIMDETETLDGSADRLFDEVLAVASGKETATETLGHREFAIHRRNPANFAIHAATRHLKNAATRWPESRYLFVVANADPRASHARPRGSLQRSGACTGPSTPTARRVASAATTAGSSARCCSSRRRSTTSTGR